MFLNLSRVYFDEQGQLKLSPILVNSSFVSCVYPSQEYSDVSIIVLNTGVEISVNGTLDALYALLECDMMESNVSLGDWIYEEEPDVEDDYIVSLEKDRFRPYSVDVDSFKNGKWKRYGRKVLAWMPFPEHFEKIKY